MTKEKGPVTSMIIDTQTVEDKPLVPVDVRALFASHGITGPVLVRWRNVPKNWGDRKTEDLLSVAIIVRLCGQRELAGHKPSPAAFPDAEQAADIAAFDSDRIESGRDPPIASERCNELARFS